MARRGRGGAIIGMRRKAKQIWYGLANDGVRICVAIFGGVGEASPLIAQRPRTRKAAAGVAGFAKVTSG